jgi:hypothetical protein
MLFSLLLATAIVWGYMTCQASFGQFLHSIAASIGAVSNVVIRTAETIEARRDLLDQAGQMLLATKSLINELRVAAENQAKMAPRYAEGIRSASTVADSLSGAIQMTGDTLLLEVPTGIRWEGLKPVVIMSRPMERAAQNLKANAQEIKVVSKAMSDVSDTIGRDGQKLSSAFMATSEQALKLVAEAEMTLGRIKLQDLPKAIEDLRTTSASLLKVSAQVEMAGNVGLVLLVVGLLLAGWSFLNSLGTLILASAQAVGSRSTTRSLAAS